MLRHALLSQADVDRLLGTHDVQEFNRTLTELKLTNGIAQGLKSAEDILPALEVWVREEVERMTPAAKKPTFSILWLEGDAPTLSYLLKEHLGRTSQISHLPESKLSAYSPEVLRECIATGDTLSPLPSPLSTLIESVRENQEISSAQIDTDVAQCIALLRSRLARASGSPLIRMYAMHLIDVENIRTALRLIEKPKEEARGFLLDGGSIKADLLAGDLQTIKKAIQRSDLHYALTDIENLATNPNALEKRLSDVLALDLRKMWNVPMGIEPLFAFAAITVSHLSLLRAIAIGKRNGLSPQDIKSFLPPYIRNTLY